MREYKRSLSCNFKSINTSSDKPIWGNSTDK